MYKILALAVATAMLCGSMGTAGLEKTDKEVDKIEAYDLDGALYISAEDASKQMGGSMSWNGDRSEVTITMETYTILISVDKPYILANERYLWTAEECEFRENDVFVPADIICRALGAEFTYYSESEQVYLNAGEPLESGDEFYNDDDIYWLSRLIYAEAGSECFEGQVAVGNVVMNRVKSDQFPDTVKEVIFDSKYSVQFTPAYSGAIYNTPSESSIIAAKLAIEGANVVEECLYFSAAYTSSWASRNRPFYRLIDNQNFYM